MISQTYIARMKIAARRISLKYVYRECIEGVVRISQSPIHGKVFFLIRDIGPKPDCGIGPLYCAIPEVWTPFVDIELWVHEFVEHTIGNLLLQIGYCGKIRFGIMPWNVPINHFITCLSTYSAVSDESQSWHIEPDEFISIFNLTSFAP
jgi:hypothetical protein